MLGDGRDIFQREHKGVSLIAEFDKVRGQFPEKVLLTTANHHICMVAELVRPASSARRRLHELVTCLGDGRDIFQREQRSLLGSGIRPSARSVS